MTRYKVKDPTGQMHIIEGPDGATPDEIINQAAQLIPSSEEPPKPEDAGSPGIIRPRTGTERAMDVTSELLKNAVKNAGEILNPSNAVRQGADAVKEVGLDIPKDLTQGLAQKIAGVITGQPQGPNPIDKRLQDIAGSEQVQRPGKFAFEHPLDAATLLLAPVMPFLGKAGVPEVAKAATIEPGAVKTGFARRMAAKAISATLGADENAVLERMKNPVEVKTAFNHPELADQMVNSVNNLHDTISELSGDAASNLRSSPYIKEGAIPKPQILDTVKAARRDLGGVFSQESQQASGALNRVMDNYSQKLRNTVSEAQVKDLIQQLDSDINWGDPSASRTNEALVGVRTRLDGILKKQNPSYAEAMKPVSDAMRTMNDVQKTFGIQRKTGEGFVLTDRTVNNIKGALKENKAATQDLLARLKNVTGEDWESKIRGANVAQAFTGERTQGSRRTVVGGAVGTAAGYLTGLPPQLTGPLGAVAGAFADLYGRPMAGKLADVLSVPEMQKYIPKLKAAAVKGPKAFAILHAKLIESDPDYTATMAGAIHASLPGSGAGQ